MNDWLTPDWPAPANVRGCVTTRSAGVSHGPYESLNLGDHVQDDPAAVAENRQRLVDSLGCRPAWLKQVHGISVVEADPAQVLEADASWTSTLGIAATIMTADCLPVLFCNRQGTRVAAAHAGWRGLVSGVLEATAASLESSPQDILVWFGPAIGPDAFEVGAEVREAFVSEHSQAKTAFKPSVNDGRFMADIYQLARLRLASIGIDAIYGGGWCTYTDTARFYSFRRSPQTGRLASLIWLTQPLDET
ncbi:peptidoglycan editing factor PgeF [Pseudomonas luteola]|uniref:peptidoglycan editing factor PgeF n=1 Tax=Pseudomonas luteola TaxID=47886 RepID=UPI001EF60D50|nr:peptidoglycan editing factor PgeF [Pseudomonas luteola]MCG7372575.1 peptidoglycan editing factor PgeF [Pseudomonas luteola]